MRILFHLIVRISVFFMLFLTVLTARAEVVGVADLPEFKIFKETVFPKTIKKDPFSRNNKLNSEIIKLHYAAASKVAKLLREKGNLFLSKNGHLSVEERTNSLWMEETPKRVKKIRDFIKMVDVPLRQVEIEARIVSVDTDFVKELGIKFGSISKNTEKDRDGFNIDLPVTSVVPGQFAFTLAKLSDNVLLDAELRALESEGRSKIISRPKLFALDRKTAKIEAGEDIPYQEKTAQGNTSIAFKKAVLGLKVTPQVISKTKVLLNISVSQDKVSPLTVNGVPAINTREVQTQVVVNNNQTIVLGGIYEEARNEVITRIPVLGSIPFVGVLFRSKKIKNTRKELLVFITPRVV